MWLDWDEKRNRSVKGMKAELSEWNKRNTYVKKLVGQTSLVALGPEYPLNSLAEFAKLPVFSIH
jgi:hypothetical protein